MNRISTKLTAYFFISVLITEIFLIGYLHWNMVHAKIDEEYTRLLATGSNHRDVLMEYYSETTMKHIVLMEKDGDREVMITNHQGDIIACSEEDGEALAQYLPKFRDLDIQQDEILIDDWKSSPYIVSAHPYQIDSDHKGFVIMYQSTQAIELLVGKLNMYFALAGGTSVIILFVIYAILSKLLTRPLIRMKEATEKLSEGDFDVSLPFIGKDELGELSGAIQKLATDLERLKTERNEFLASIAHELSTPLTYLIGYSKVAMRQDVDEKSRADYLEIIAEESDRMKDLVKDLLDLAKIDENTFTIMKENFRVRSFLEEIVKRVTPSFNLKNIHLHLICDDDIEINADPLRFEQVILNLLDNALKYSPEQSTVEVKVAWHNEQVAISVIDFGIGIPSEEIEFIFEKLYRVEKSRSRASGGSGLGLSIVQELIEAHGGKIEVESSVGKGSTFTIVI